ncbi:hypothetical protein [Agrobacterium sp. SORGH_AS 787]|uniref:hypothetical protein n=1 Tax=Agrobacterium sp. SORGH_AS 787 TaxID=3041775 RepID=UPI00278B336B|nr:hypothetical protein [Rhizobium sp. SORGH_AS_0787]
MSRTFEAEPILLALIKEYQDLGCFIFNDDGKIYARVTSPENDQGEVHFKMDFCLTTIAETAAERLSS